MSSRLVVKQDADVPTLFQWVGVTTPQSLMLEAIGDSHIPKKSKYHLFLMAVTLILN